MRPPGYAIPPTLAQVSTRICSTCVTKRSGFADQISAATPLTWGAAMDVPYFEPYPAAGRVL